MGSPQPPTPEQHRALERAGRLIALEPARRAQTQAGTIRLTFTLPRQGVSLIRLTR
jgi:xylan 1,4-beta-xylosidase